MCITQWLFLLCAAGYGAGSYEDMLKGARRTFSDLSYFVELHIEQVGAVRVRWFVGCW
jgi:hypothetical protein